MMSPAKALQLYSTTENEPRTENLLCDAEWLLQAHLLDPSSHLPSCYLLLLLLLRLLLLMSSNKRSRDSEDEVPTDLVGRTRTDEIPADRGARTCSYYSC